MLPLQAFAQPRSLLYVRSSALQHGHRRHKCCWVAEKTANSTIAAATAATGSTASTALSSGSCSAEVHVQHPAHHHIPVRAAAVTVTWPGLLAALVLAATALVAAATTCFFMYIRPVMKAMAVTLAEMEAAAKEMQQAAQEVEELVGRINSAIKLLMQPTALLKWTSNTASSSSSPASSTDEASTTTNTAAATSAVLHDSTIGMQGSAAAAAAAGSSNSAAWQMADQLEGLRPGLLEGLKAFQKLQFRGAELGLAGLKLAGLDDEAGRQEKQDRSRVKQAKLSKTAGPPNNSSTSMVWDVLASSLSTRATRRSLARLRSDLAAAANVLTVLLAPPSKRLYEQIQAEDQLQLQQPLPEQQPATAPQPLQQTQVRDMQSQQQPAASSSSHDDGHAAAAATTRTGRRSRVGTANSNTASGSGSIKARRAVQLDEWGLPITAAEAAEAAAYQAAAPDDSQQLPAASFSPAPVADPARQQRVSSKRQITAAAPGPQQQWQQQQWQQQQQRLCGSSDDEDSWHLDLSHYGRYLEHEHAAMADKADSGITWQQLQQDASLMQRVFCDNQELALAQQLEQQQQRQQVKPQQNQSIQQQQQPISPEGHSHDSFN